MFSGLNKAPKKNRGFTLVELMVVVAVIGILVAVAVPVYSGVQDRAKKGVGEANAEILNRGIAQWEMLENKGAEYVGDNQEDLLEFLGLEKFPDYVEWDSTDGKYVSSP